MVTTERANVRAAIKLVNWNGAAAARAMPDSRCVLILRHPCGQIASVQTGLTTQVFRLPREVRDSSSTSAAYAARHGVNQADFDALSNVAKFAWYWRAFNETAVEALGHLANAKIVVYEDLCREPVEKAHDLFTFAGLGWSSQTADFINQSTSANRSSGYFDVFRSSATVADQWRQILPEADQKIVYDVVRDSPLARYWPDLTRVE